MPIVQFNRGLTPGVTAPPPPATLKRNNIGNYIILSGDLDVRWNVPTGPVFGVLQRLQADSPFQKFKGAVIRVNWDDMEPTKGNYDFSMIQNCLTDINPLYGNKLGILIHIKTFSGSQPAVPSYMRTLEYQDPDFPGNLDYCGCYPYASAIGGPGGYVVSMHLPAVAARMKLLTTALANAFDSNPQFELISFTENSISKPINAPMVPDIDGAEASPGPDWSRVYDWFNNMTDVFRLMKVEFQGANILQLINADREYMSNNVQNTWSGYVPTITDLGVGLCLPDGCPDTTEFAIQGLHPGNFQLLTDLAKPKHCPRGVLVSPTALITTTANKAQAGFPFPGNTRQAEMDWARNSMFVNYMLWSDLGGYYNTTWNAYGGTWTTTPATDAISGNYLGQSYNVITDNWIRHVSSDISVSAL